MCWIAYKPEGTKFPDAFGQWLANANANNPDGIGAMCLKRNRVEFRKDFQDTYDALEWLLERERYACAVHCRLATHGLVNELMRHPFPLSGRFKRVRGTCKAALMHNGVLRGLGGAKKSDTAELAMLLRDIPMEVLIRDSFLRLLDVALDGDRLLIFAAPRTVLMLGRWHEEDGLYTSNLSHCYLHRQVVYRWGRCELCGQARAVQETRYGLLCASCLAELEDDEEEENAMLKWDTCALCGARAWVSELKGKWYCDACRAYIESALESGWLICRSCGNAYPPEEMVEFVDCRFCLDCARDLGIEETEETEEVME